MDNRSDVVTFVKTKDGEIYKGRYKFPLDITEKQALKIVLHQFTMDELKDIVDITFDPVIKLYWLQNKKIYSF